MSTLIILALSATACCLLLGCHPAWLAHRRLRPNHLGAFARHHDNKAFPERQPRLVRQVALLLATGRTGPLLWEALARVLALEYEQSRVQRRPPPSVAAGNYRQRTAQQRTGAGTAVEPSASVDATVGLVLAVQRATLLGLPTAEAIRQASAAMTARRWARPQQHGGTLTDAQLRMWLDLAACFDVCEASGAPVAAVLQRLANTMEADQDALALRETALAGPRATVRLLSWLPFVGLGLGILMGVDPLSVLVSSPMGWTVLGMGVGFAAIGRFWSARMITQAGRPDTSGTRVNARPQMQWSATDVLKRG